MKILPAILLAAAACALAACSREPAGESVHEAAPGAAPLAGPAAARPLDQTSTAVPTNTVQPGSTPPAAIAAAGLAEGDTGDRSAEDAVEVAGNSHIETHTADVAAGGSAVPTAARARPALKPIPIPAKHRISAAIPGRATRVSHTARDRAAMGRTPTLSRAAAGRSSAKDLVATGTCPGGKLDKFKPAGMEKSELPSTPTREGGAAMRQEPDAGAGR